MAVTAARGADIRPATLTLRQASRPGRPSRVEMTGQLGMPDPLEPVVDPMTDGLQLRIEDAGSPGGALLERTLLLPDPLDTDGWQARGGRLVWKGAAVSTPRVGTLKLTLVDRRASAGVVDVKLAAKAPLPPARGALRVTLVFDAKWNTTDRASSTGACATHTFACTQTSSGRVSTCR